MIARIILGTYQVEVPIGDEYRFKDMKELMDLIGKHDWALVKNVHGKWCSFRTDLVQLVVEEKSRA